MNSVSWYLKSVNANSVFGKTCLVPNHIKIPRALELDNKVSQTSFQIVFHSVISIDGLCVSFLFPSFVNIF